MKEYVNFTSTTEILSLIIQNMPVLYGDKFLQVEKVLMYIVQSMDYPTPLELSKETTEKSDLKGFWLDCQKTNIPG